MKSRSVAFLLLLLAALLASCSRPAPSLPSKPLRTEPWDPALVESLASTPLQDGGRSKPLATLASFALYHVHGRRDLQYTIAVDGKEQKVTLEPTEWLLDVWCFPDQAADYPLFRIENSAVLDALGFANEGQSLRFDFLSYKQLLGAAERLDSLSGQYRRIEQRDRNLVQEHIINLDDKLGAYHRLHQQLGVLHSDIRVEGDELRAALGLKGTEQIRLGTFLQRADAFVALVRGVGQNPADPKLGNAMRIIDVLSDIAASDRGPHLFPQPRTTPEDETWDALREVIDGTLRGRDTKAEVSMLVHLQDAIAAKDMASRGAALRAWHTEVVAGASARGEFGKVVLETYYYRASWQYHSIHWFLLGFVLAAFCWLLPRNRWLWWGSVLATGTGLGMLVYDVVLRCMITGRPPITNLYDTFLFIAAVGVATSLVVEFILPRRIALALAALLGALLVMFARMFEVTKGEDTMAPLIAVLDSNFWLATHVTIINTGYSAGLVAALLANAWILARGLRIAHPSDSIAKALIRMTYGVTCFSLVFSVVGTILGGVWANDSWGRFWGWDPKENGALLICLSQIALLHARMSGMVRDFGFAVWSSITGMIVLFSWFHVNLLGVGLHAYGFSSGLREAVWTGYCIEAAIIGLGFVDYVLRPNPVAPAAKDVSDKEVRGDAAWPATE
jgi:ABC-type transport system involved in cytochrome c biogenesis permease subunit